MAVTLTGLGRAALLEHIDALERANERLTSERDEALRSADKWQALCEQARLRAAGGLRGWWCLACRPETWNPEGHGERAACRKCGAEKPTNDGRHG